MKQYLRNAAAALSQVVGLENTGRGSWAYTRDKSEIWGGKIPEKYMRVIDLVPGDRVLELGAAEGVLSLLLAQTKLRVIALEKKKHRHEEALQLQALWRSKGHDVDRCEMVLGQIKDHLDLLEQVDTLLAVRSIYYLPYRPRYEAEKVFDHIGKHVRHVVLCGNRSRAQRYFEANGQPDDHLGELNFYASLEGMTKLLQNRGYAIEKTVAEGDPIVVGVNKSLGSGSVR